jgi:hypothetical protein
MPSMSPEEVRPFVNTQLSQREIREVRQKLESYLKQVNTPRDYLIQRIKGSIFTFFVNNFRSVDWNFPSCL